MRSKLIPLRLNELLDPAAGRNYALCAFMYALSNALIFV
jgi:hypothetical protein